MSNFLRFLTLLIAILSSCSQASYGSSDKDGQNVTFVKNFDFYSIFDNPERHWVVAVINPATGNNVLQVRSMYMDVETGKIVQQPNKQDFYAVKGDLHILGTLTKGPDKKDWTYNWQIPGRLIESVSRAKPKTTLQQYSPFVNGGTIVFPLDGNLKDPTQILPFYLVPDNWATFVLPAFKFQQSRKALFDETKVVANAKQLTALLDDTNPFNAIAAARVLAPQRGLDVPFITSTLSSSKNYTQAIFAYLTFKNAHPIRQVAIDSALSQVIDKTASSETLKWITLGITTAQNDDGQSYFALKDRVKVLLLKVDARQKALNTKTPDDDYVNELLTSAQVRQVLPLLATPQPKTQPKLTR